MSDTTASQADASGVSMPQEPSVDAVYAEWYNESRRYRDFEQIAASWASTVLLALTGGALTLLTGEKAPKLSPVQKYAFVAAILLVTAVADGIVLYVGRRYQELKRQAKFIEPRWKEELYKQTVSPLPRFFHPLNGQLALVTVLGLLAAVVVLAIQ